MTDAEFLMAFEDGQLSPREFDHRAHLRAAWVALQRYGLEEGVERTCGGIQNLATRFGAPEKFHRTLSEALVRLMYSANSNSASRSFDDYLRAHSWLTGDIRPVLAAYYSPTQLYSERAKRSFVPPDLKPLP